MAKKKTDVAVIDETENLPAFLQNYKGATGAEDIGTEDVAIPRVKLAQGLTPEVKEGSVEDGALFLSVTGEILASPGDKLRFTVIAQSKEFILWSPNRAEGILARAVRVIDRVDGEDVVRYLWDKQNESFTVKFKDGPKVTWHTKKFVDENGMDKWGSKIPGDPDSGIAATAHHNYVVSLPDYDDQICAMSLSVSQVKRAKDLNAMLLMNRKVPIFGRIYTATAIGEKNTENQDYFNYRFKPAGLLTDPELFEYLTGLHEGFKDRGFVVDQTDGGDDDAAESTSI